MAAAPDGGDDSARPARVRSSAFGTDAQLADDLPANFILSRFQQEVKSVLAEYFVCPAVEDTATRIAELLGDCPSEADELGVLAIRGAIDNGNESARKAVVDLLTHLYDSSKVDMTAMIRSFEKLFCAWEDIAIDAPKAPGVLLNILHGCIVGGVVERSLLTKLPESLLNAGSADVSDEFKTMLAGVTEDLKAFKKEVSNALEEYFLALNTEEVANRMIELNMKSFHHELVKKAIILSFTAQGDEEKAREDTLELLSNLAVAGIIGRDDLQWGVTRLLGQLDDLELDCPRAAELTTEFCAGMVADELVSVPFLRRCRMLRIGGAVGLRVLDGTQRRTPDYSKRHLGKMQFKRELQTMILEYYNSGDETEFGRCVRELSPMAPEKSAELIRKIMVLAMERSANECEMALKLLVWLCRQEELDVAAMERGFDDLYAHMDDVCLDVPDARDMARTFVVEAQKAGILCVEKEKLVEWLGWIGED